PLADEPWFWNVHWRQGETEEDSLGNQVLWLVGRALDLVYGKGELSEYYSLLHEAENWYASLSECFRGIKYADPIEDGLRKIHFAVPAA
ncbi:hypothetical protein KXW31_000550, partial [Aspergillus fumigatus]